MNRWRGGGGTGSSGSFESMRFDSEALSGVRGEKLEIVFLFFFLGSIACEDLKPGIKKKRRLFSWAGRGTNAR